MSADALYREMGLKGYRVEDTWKAENGTLFVLVSVPRESMECRSCNCRRVHVHDWRQRFWKAAPLGVTPVIVTMKTPRVKCLNCESRTWHQRMALKNHVTLFHKMGSEIRVSASER